MFTLGDVDSVWSDKVVLYRSITLYLKIAVLSSNLYVHTA